MKDHSCENCGIRGKPERIVRKKLPVTQPAPPQRDTVLRFVSAVELMAYASLVSDDYDPSITKAVESFIRNMERVKQTIRFPIDLVGLVGVDRSVYGAISSRVRRLTKYQKSADDETLSQTLADIYNEECEIQAEEFDIGTTVGWLGRQQVDFVISLALEWAKPGATAILSATVIGAWTAYESLVEDLWVQCLNARPRLGLIAVDAGPVDNDDADERERKQRVKIPIPASMFKEKDFKPCEHMGDILRDTKTWNFSRRIETFKAYKSVFGKDDKGEVNRAMERSVENLLRNDELRWLSALRNALIHSAGFADQEFHNHVCQHPQLKAVAVTQEIPLTGELVASFVNIADTHGAKLIGFVSDWLKSNPA